MVGAEQLILQMFLSGFPHSHYNCSCHPWPHAEGNVVYFTEVLFRYQCSLEKIYRIYSYKDSQTIFFIYTYSSYSRTYPIICKYIVICMYICLFYNKELTYSIMVTDNF